MVKDGLIPAMLARVIKVRDVNADGSPDILVGTTFQTQSQLYLGDGSGDFTNVTRTRLFQIKASIGDLEFGDVDGDGDLDVVLADWGKEGPMSEVRVVGRCCGSTMEQATSQTPPQSEYAQRAGLVLLGA